FFKEMVVSNFRVLKAVITPGISYHPGTFTLPMDCASDLEITLLANLITLTPGTLSVDVSPDRTSLYVHTMFAEDPDGVIKDIKNGLERRLLELLR
ncbi:MAG TPA: Na+/H+ antiporter subunit E, partial [Candidatus Hydrogenedentes bacterium]|nr:Na+/H+ antiporter subunit E [Candidatus Hydrogenedentota bacterium]